MSSFRKPRNWLCFAAFAAAFWITIRVMAATVPAPVVDAADPTSTGGASFADEGRAPFADELPDPALDKMIGHFARAARSRR